MGGRKEAAGVPAFVSHVSDDGERFEPVRVHLREVAEMAREFARPFGAGDWAYAVGMLHDIGKYSPGFQRRILRDGPRVDHSTAGALELWDDFLHALSYCAAGHHGGLPDGGTPVDEGGTLLGRLACARRGDVPDCSAWRSELVPPAPCPPALRCPPRDGEAACYCLAFLTRMVFSCLVDADFLCTERFMRGEAREALSHDGLGVLRDRLEERLSRFYPPATPLNEVRCGLLDDCLAAAREAPGVFSLTAPTGSGKTYALMRFALHHAAAGAHMRRVIVAEPFTSIIEQNAEVYREVFGEKNVLEHHANFDFECVDGRADGLGERLRLASENWDAPIIVTTNVRLFESLYAHKTSQCRKLHNIAGSVIVLDEAQMIPTPYLLPCVRALAELVRNYGCSVVLCTATQPALNRYFEREGLSVREMASDVPALFDSLRRVTYRALGRCADQDLARRILRAESALCIVSSRKQARRLYELLVEERGDADGVFHLTTLMHPVHRMCVLATINRRMKVDREPCLVVATSLVEAGVDLDFPVVFRAVAGLDSMVQAAGRCNREGRRPAEESTVYLFYPDERYKAPADVRQRAEVSAGVIEGLGSEGGKLDPADPLTVEAFFSRLYFYKGEQALDAKGILKRLSSFPSFDGGPSIPFKSVSDDVNIIEDGAYTVIVPDGTVRDEVARLQDGFATRADMRRLSRHAVSIYQVDRDNLLAYGVIRQMDGDVCLLVDEARYREDIGLDVEITGGEGVFL